MFISIDACTVVLKVILKIGKYVRLNILLAVKVMHLKLYNQYGFGAIS